ncbi:MAG TPA: glycosyltransferase family 9 protein [Candidatus Dormibacteraeota bacterium]|nr:glycosyltransferase family 9 protein [Candidatus Dormibacteraeota bacterium]
MANDRFLIIRLSSLGDIVLTAPAVAMLRGSFPDARIDWLIDKKWAALFSGCTDFHEVIEIAGSAVHNFMSTVQHLRKARYTCVIDFQGLYKSALLAFLSTAPRRIGLARGFAREGGAAMFYTERIVPSCEHIVDQNRALARAAGAGPERFPPGFPRLTIAPEEIVRRTVGCSLKQFFVINAGGGWGSKCWPADRYGILCRELEARYAFRAVVNYGPGERALADSVARAASPAEVVFFCGEIQELTSLLAGAKFVVAGDTGPLHLAVAMGTPVVGLYGATDWVRNGPYNRDDIIVCNDRFEGMMHQRGHQPAASMLSITVEQVLAAVAQRLEKTA